MTEATSSFHDQSCDLWAGEVTLTAWKSESEVTLTDWEAEFAETDEFIFLNAAFTALQKEWCKIADADFAEMTLTARESDVEKISAEITAENLKNS